MKIRTWKAWHDPNGSPTRTEHSKWSRYPAPCRVVPEATWRKVMAVVKAAEAEANFDPPFVDPRKMEWAISALREHERKRK